jgi:transposase
MSAERITSPYAPDLGEVRAFLERMISARRFAELVTAILAFVTRVCEVNGELEKKLAQLRRRRPRSEVLGRIERQLTLSLVDLGQAPPAAARPTSDDNATKKKSRKGSHPGRRTPAAHLERVEVFNPVPPEMRTCPHCGTEMKTVGHSRCERLNVIPARVIVEVRLDERVACPHDDTIVSAPTPPAIVERGVLADDLITEATAEKLIVHMPIDRQCTRYASMGVEIAPQTLRRAVSAHIDLLAPVAKLIADKTRGPGLLGTDATGIPVLDPSVVDGIRTGAMWCWTNARWVSFDTSRSADSASVRRFLGDDLKRIVQCDGTNTLTFLERAGGKRPGCWAHARRGLAETARAGDALALEGLRIIQGIFAVERESALAGDGAEHRRQRRREHTMPIIDDIRRWLDEKRGIVPPKSSLGKALGYIHRQWHRLVLFLDDGNIEATNNRRERACPPPCVGAKRRLLGKGELRRLILGRKNWLFTWLDEGGERVANILSIIATCIAHDVNPRLYLHFVTRLIVKGWPQIPDRLMAEHPELAVKSTPELPP